MSKFNPKNKTLKSEKFWRKFLLGNICFVFMGAFVVYAEPDIEVLHQDVQKQKKNVERLQILAAEQFQKMDELEQSLPPVDLLDSLQNGLQEAQNEIKKLAQKVASLEKKLALQEKNVAGNNEPRSEQFVGYDQMTLGLIALQAGDPGEAARLLQDTLKGKADTKVKESILMALGRGFLEQNHFQQSAFYLGSLLKDFPKSQQVPAALFHLGTALGGMGEKDQQAVLWDELKKKYPNHHYSKKLAAKK